MSSLDVILSSLDKNKERRKKSLCLRAIADIDSLSFDELLEHLEK